jgi:cysteine desulfurase
VSRAYLDHASSSPLRPAALDAMLPYLREHHADPGRVHQEGHVTRAAIEEAREQVAGMFGARAREVMFTASGTESVNTAVFGALGRHAAKGVGHVVTSAVEHSAVLEAAHRGATEVTEVGVDKLGRYDPAAILAACRPDTALVSVQLANHEVGTMQPAAAVITGARERGITVHVDACAAAGHVPVDFGGLGADLLSVTAHKFGGPKGAAALFVRRGLRFPPFVVGGAQERARRGGIENVPAIVGFGAVAVAVDVGAEAAHSQALTDRLAAGALAVAGVTRLGDPVDALPQLVCLGIEGVEAEPILLGLDRRGVAVHSGSSCSSEALEPSPVLAAMGAEADRSLRASVGWCSTDADVDAFLAAFPEVVAALRSLRA